MDPFSGLHARLVAMQTTDELHRKAMKARCKNVWTVEDIDLALRVGSELVNGINWDEPTPTQDTDTQEN